MLGGGWGSVVVFCTGFLRDLDGFWYFFFLELLLHCFCLVFKGTMGARGVMEVAAFGGFGICFLFFLFFLEGMVLC